MSWISEGDEITKLVNKGNANYKFGAVGKKLTQTLLKSMPTQHGNNFNFLYFMG